MILDETMFGNLGKTKGILSKKFEWMQLSPQNRVQMNPKKKFLTTTTL